MLGNENWTRRWDGAHDDVLIAQSYSSEDDLDFIRSIERALRDPRYLRIGGKLAIVVYRPSLLPDSQSTVQRWKQYCKEREIGELYLYMTT